MSKLQAGSLKMVTYKKSQMNQSFERLFDMNWTKRFGSLKEP